MLLKSRFVEMFIKQKFPLEKIGNLVDKNVHSAKKVFSSEDSIKYIDISSIDNVNNTMTGYAEYLMKEAPSRAQQHIEKGDILISTVRPNLRNVALTSYSDSNLVASSGFCVLRAKRCLPEYLLSIVCSDNFTNEMSNKVTGANYPAIKDADVYNYEIPMPPLELQTQYVNFLKQIDKLKVILNKVDEKFELLKKSRFVELFGDPVQNEKKWPIDFCKNLTLKIGSGATPKGGQQSYCTEGISLIRSMNVFNNHFDYTDLAHINDEQAHALDNVIIEENDVLLNITGASVARCCLVPSDVLPARVNQHVSIIRCKERLLPEFICSLFTSEKYQKLLLNTARAGGATREALTKQQIENLKIIIPPLKEQNKYIKEIKQLDKLKVETIKKLMNLIE